MSSGTHIQWTDATWSPVTGCTRVSEGCRNCYAERMTATRLAHHPRYAGLAVMTPSGARWSGAVRCHEELLTIPLRWRKPRKIFVCDMSDLFHEGVPFEFVARVFAVMKRCPQHTFQILTKRPPRMAAFLAACADGGGLGWITHDGTEPANAYLGTGIIIGTADCWPLPNVWLGVSCENQAALDERVPHLLRCPAVIRFLSLEPLLGPIRLSWLLDGVACEECADWGEVGGEPCPRHHGEEYEARDYALEQAAFALRPTGAGMPVPTAGLIHWIICGGESGPQSRPCDVDSIRGIVEECKASGTPCFVKQLGSRPVRRDSAGESVKARGDDDRAADHEWPEGTRFSTRPGEPNGRSVLLPNRKGGDPAEWPEDLRVREFPVSHPHSNRQGRTV